MPASPPSARPGTSTDPSRGSAPRVAASAAIAAPLVFAAGTTWAAARQPPGYDATQTSVTALGAAGTPYAWVSVVTLALTGVLVTLTGACLPARHPRPASPAVRLTIAVSGLALVAIGLLPQLLPGVPPHLITALGALSLLGLAGWPALDTASLRPLGPAGLRAGILTALVVGLVIAATTPTPYGTYERVVALILLTHLAAVAARRWWAAGHRLGTRPVRMLAAGILLALVAGAAGVVATVVIPVSVSTTNYQAHLSFSPNPSDLGQIVVPTVLGDLRATFTGAALGVTVTPQIRATITEALGSPSSSLESLQPSPAEIDAAIRDAVQGLLLRFVVGATLAILLVVLVRALTLRRAPGIRTALVAVASLVAATGGLGLAVEATYRGSTPREFTATGLLGAVQRNRDLFDDVAARSNQAAPYLRNLVAVSNALRERYEPQPVPETRVLRILLVSDIHAANQYPLMRSLIEEEGVNVVIDSGDLVNFGTVAEGEFAGVFRGIASLGVPYVFVKGNHDATSPTDEAMLRRLDGIPNVVLVQPNSQSYAELTVAGVRIAGFNDPRWYGDDGIGSAEKQKPARAAWLAAFAGRPVPDVVVSHEPWAVQGIPGAGVLVNGHMHSAFREGNRIQVGTFTGGGPFSHFIVAAGGQELIGQPAAFDILDVGADCRVSALTRYRFSGVIEGRPSFTDVTLVNGRSVDSRPVEADRRCAADIAPNVVTIPADAKPDEASG